MPLFIGIDPGLERIGFAVLQPQAKQPMKFEIETYGLIQTSADQSTPQRLQQIHQDLTEVITPYCSTDTKLIAGVEQLFFMKNVTTGIVVAQARGVILFTLQTLGCTIQEVTPVGVKQALTGNGQADKKMVQQMVQLELGLPTPPQPDDVADALAIALTTAWLHRSQLTAS